MLTFPLFIHFVNRSYRFDDIVHHFCFIFAIVDQDPDESKNRFVSPVDVVSQVVQSNNLCASFRLNLFEVLVFLGCLKKGRSNMKTLVVVVFFFCLRCDIHKNCCEFLVLQQVRGNPAINRVIVFAVEIHRSLDTVYVVDGWLVGCLKLRQPQRHLRTVVDNWDLHVGWL